MAKRGRKPLPDAVLQARGSRMLEHRGKRNIPYPDIPDDCPIPPLYMSNEGKKWFEIFAIKCWEMKVFTVADTESMVMLAESFAEYLYFQRKVLNENEHFYENERTGTVGIHPSYKAMCSAWERAFKLMQHFGLTPSSRVSIQVKDNSSNKKPIEPTINDFKFNVS